MVYISISFFERGLRGAAATAAAAAAANDDDDDNEFGKDVNSTEFCHYNVLILLDIRL